MKKRRGRTITIRFRENKVSKVSGAKDLLEAGMAGLFAQAFVDELTPDERIAAATPREQKKEEEDPR